MSDLLISVVMPAYNAGKYIAAAIDSVLQQSFAGFELLIIDDGSSDDTEKVIHSFHDPRIIYLHQAHSGVAVALNNGLAKARGKYIARFDADDICAPDRFKKQLAFLQDHPAYVLVGSDAEYLLENGEYLFLFTCIAHTHEEIMQKLYFYCPFIHSAVMYRRDAVMQAGGYSPHAHNFEDYLLWIRLVRYGKFHNLHGPLIKVRFNPASVTIDEKWRSPRFRKLKRNIIRRGIIKEEEGYELLSLIKAQDNARIKEGAYHALCAKKFLTDNYQPGIARKHLHDAIRSNPYRLDNYALLAVSYLPQPVIQWLHKISPNKL
jgi:glycosyltransferase involved in cell wall biosynthesis